MKSRTKQQIRVLHTKSDCKSQNVVTWNPVGDGDGDGDGDIGMLKEAIYEEKRGRRTPTEETM